MKRVAVVVVLCGLALSVLFAAEESKLPQAPAEDILMRAKLASSQKVIEGLVEKDFAQIQKAGEELVKVGEAGEWGPHEDQAYDHFRKEFRRQAHKLTAFGEQQNLEGATYAYLALVTTCVDCHSHCRDVLRIASEPPNLKVVPIPTNDGRVSDDERRRLAARADLEELFLSRLVLKHRLLIDLQIEIRAVPISRKASGCLRSKPDASVFRLIWSKPIRREYQSEDQ